MESIPFCKRVIFWGQYGETCWFNAILMAVLYSQHSRNIIYQQSKHWDKRIQLFRLLQHVLKYKYIKTKNPEKDYKFFEQMSPEKLLKILSKKHSKYLPATFEHGYVTTLFISKLYKILGVDCLMFYLLDKKLYYDLANHTENIDATATGISYTFKYKSEQFIKSKLNTRKNPRVIIINADQRKTKLDTMKQHYQINPQYEIKNPHESIIELESTIMYNGEEYVLDSILLQNWNTSANIPGHSIAGITCKNERYVFNGWTRYTADRTLIFNNMHADHRDNEDQALEMQRIPCEFMQYDWNQQKDKEFCISKKRCALDKASIQDLDTRMCFSFSRGSRNLIYIKKSALTDLDHLDLPHTPEHVSYRTRQPRQPRQPTEPKEPKPPRQAKEPKTKKEKQPKCPEGKIRNPITRRCIQIKTAEKRGLIRKKSKKGTI